MNAVEIESAVSELAAQPFDAQEFPFRFLEAYDNKAATLAKLRSGSTNKSDIEGGIDPGKLEKLIHMVFDNVRLDIEIQDRFGKIVKPREWFIVPLPIINKLIELIQKGEASGLYYDPAKAELIRATK